MGERVTRGELLYEPGRITVQPVVGSEPHRAGSILVDRLYGVTDEKRDASRTAKTLEKAAAVVDPADPDAAVTILEDRLRQGDRANEDPEAATLVDRDAAGQRAQPDAAPGIFQDRVDVRERTFFRPVCLEQRRLEPVQPVGGDPQTPLVVEGDGRDSEAPLEYELFVAVQPLLDREPAVALRVLEVRDRFEAARRDLTSALLELAAMQREQPLVGDHEQRVRTKRFERTHEDLVEARGHETLHRPVPVGEDRHARADVNRPVPTLEERSREHTAGSRPVRDHPADLALLPAEGASAVGADPDRPAAVEEQRLHRPAQRFVAEPQQLLVPHHIGPPIGADPERSVRAESYLSDGGARSFFSESVDFELVSRPLHGVVEFRAGPHAAVGALDDRHEAVRRQLRIARCVVHPEADTVEADEAVEAGEPEVAIPGLDDTVQMAERKPVLDRPDLVDEPARLGESRGVGVWSLRPGRTGGAGQGR